MAMSPLTVSGFDRSAPQDNASLLKRVIVGIGPVVLLYVLYSIVRFMVADRGPDLGFSNAKRLLDLEDRFGIGWERALQTALLPHNWIVRGSNWYYVFGFLPILIGSALMAAWRASSSLRYWRLVFGTSLIMALVGYSTFPLAPPRLLPEHWGFVDTLLVYGPRYYGDAKGSSLFNGFGSLPSTVNVYAAMPSMHVAWSVIAGILFAASFNNRRWAVILAMLHPVLMAFAVIVTGNHYLLDIVAGLIVLGIAIVLVRTYERRTITRTTPATIIRYQG
jgi:membrane-associated phospholipid phosphatase